MAEPPPPSYDDVLAAGSSRVVPTGPSPGSQSSTPIAPSGPSRQRTEQQQRTGGRSQGGASSAEGHRRSAPRSSTPQTGSRSTGPAQRQQQRQRKEPPRGCGEKVARFSMPSLMLAGVSKQEDVDPELDHEAHLPGGINHSRLMRRRRLQSFCGCLWCIGFLLLFCFVALPVAMIMAGVFGMDSCPYMSNLVIIYLYAGGGLLALAVALRLCSSTLTCCKLTNVWNTAHSSCCSTVIVLTEAVFILSVVLNVVMVSLGGYFVLRDTPRFEPSSTTGDENYCDSGIYLATTIFIGLAAVLALCLAVVLMLAGCCYTIHRDLYSTPGAARASGRSRRSPGRNSQWTTSF